MLLTKIICEVNKNDNGLIKQLVTDGMSIALTDLNKVTGSEALNIKQTVLDVFVELNNPVGLMLKLREDFLSEDLEFAAANGYDFVLADVGCLSNISEGGKQFLNQLKLICLVKGEAALENLRGLLSLAHGYYFEAEVFPEFFHELYAHHKMLFLSESLRKTSKAFADGIVFDSSVTGERLKAFTVSETSSDNNFSYINTRLDSLPENPQEAVAFGAVLAARCSNAKAIVALTFDGENITKLSSYYLPIPIIAVANRKTSEKLLLSLIGHYGVLPTAITKIPAEKNKHIEFAEFVAGLYGYEAGEIVVITGHFNRDENPDYVQIQKLGGN